MVDVEAGKLRLTVRELIAIIVALVAVGWGIAPKIWGAATWKDGVDQNLQQINQHLQQEDRRLEWLMEHNPDSKEVPQSLTRSIAKNSIPEDAENNRPQDALIPLRP